MIMTMTTIMMKKSGKDVSAEPAPVANLSETELVSTSGTLVNTNTNTNTNTNIKANSKYKLKVRPEEAGILLVVLGIWIGAILLFYSRSSTII